MIMEICFIILGCMSSQPVLVILKLLIFSLDFKLISWSKEKRIIEKNYII